ncbi:hypothetical protein HZC33_01280 [Candidatus Wolfebacteria bacterium]|nr:hypothetical protein [Candidatus Wolfebacteria bacterium]
MRRFAFLFLILAVVSLNACAGALGIAYVGGKARYGSEEQYNSGDHSGFSDAEEMAKIQNEKESLRQKKDGFDTAMAKLYAQPTMTKTENGISMGFKGIVVNSTKETVTAVIINNSTGLSTSYTLDSEKEQEDYLLPGEYTAVFNIKGQEKARWIFHVTGAIHYFKEKKVHWATFLSASSK